MGGGQDFLGGVGPLKERDVAGSSGSPLQVSQHQKGGGNKRAGESNVGVRPMARARGTVCDGLRLVGGVRKVGATPEEAPGTGSSQGIGRSLNASIRVFSVRMAEMLEKGTFHRTEPRRGHMRYMVRWHRIVAPVAAGKAEGR